MSQPFDFVLIGYVQTSQAFCTRYLEVHGSVCALRLRYNTSIRHCQTCSYQFTSRRATQLVKFLLTLSRVRLCTIWYLLSLLSSVIHIARHVSDHKISFPKLFCFVLFLACLFWFYFFVFASKLLNFIYWYVAIPYIIWALTSFIYTIYVYFHISLLYIPFLYCKSRTTCAFF